MARLTCGQAAGKIVQEIKKSGADAADNRKRNKINGLKKNSGHMGCKDSRKVKCPYFHRQGVTWAGKIALKIYPQILEDLASQVRKDIFVVCGTNGKNDDQQYALRSAGSRRK